MFHYEAIPMGFETHIVPANKRSNNCIMKQSLWDLKLLVALLKGILCSNYEAIPMGFETL